MSDISSVLIEVEVSGRPKGVVGFNKKNSWKNEWEKAQLKSVKNETEKSVKKTEIKEGVRLSNSGFYVTVNNVDDKEIKNTALVNRPAQLNHMSSIKPESNKVYFSTSPVVLNASEVSSSHSTRAFQNIANNIKEGAAFNKNEYASGVLHKTEVRYGALFKPQSLNFLMTDNGVKMILRDYRLDKDQLDKIIEVIRRHLREFGMDMNEVVVNGVVNENV